MQTIKLCCGGRGCPTLTKENGKFIIEDDDGGMVILTKEELIELVEKVPELLED